MTDELQLTAIYIYPVKSLGGISLPEAQVEDRGLRYDRQWMLTDTNGHFLSQRQCAAMALLRVGLQQEGLAISHKNGHLKPLFIEFKAHSGTSIPVTVWGDTCPAHEVSAAANAWFSEALQREVRLVYMPSSTRRRVDTRYAGQKEIVSFADGYPFLLIGQASLDDLNSRLPAPLPMNRFRPNLVFKGGEAFCEDRFHIFKAGGITFRVAKPCARCIVTTIDQDSGTRSPEPLRTLSSYRRQGNKILFGQNLLHTPETRGTIRVGERLQILSWKN